MSIVLFGCKQDAIDEGLTTEEVQAISSASNNVVEDAINKAINDGSQIDPAGIAEQISKIEGVVSAGLNETSSGVVVELEGGLSSTVLLINKADNRWYVEETDSESTNTMSDQNTSPKQTVANIILPKGNGKALILAPFQRDFIADLDYVYEKLESIGYKVDSFLNKNASLQRFRGDFLSQYDIVIFDSHGEIYDYDEKYPKTGIATGTVWTKENSNAMPVEERNLLFTMSIEGVLYYAFNAQFLRATTTKNFKDTWIFNASCLGTYYDVGDPSLSAAFLDLGAKGYNGFDFDINVDLSNAMMKKMVDNFSDKQNFLDASDKTKNAWYPKYMVYKNFLFTESTIAKIWNKDNTLLDDGIAISPDFFDTHQRGEDSFYIVPPDGYQVIPTVNISSINNITESTAVCNSEVTYEGWRRVTARGVCWSTSQNPTIANSKTTDGTGIGPFTSYLSGLSPNTTYYVRAYATNANGTAYDEMQKTFTTLSDSDIEYGSLTDSRDGTVYKTVDIGEQVWMAENLRYLPSVIGANTSTTDSKCYYVYGYEGTDVDAAKATDNYKIYGVLYNYSAANASCPEGWHIPNDIEWEQLATFLGGKEVAGGKMKETGTIHWSSPNEGATNSSGFTALPSGVLDYQWFYRKKTFKAIGTVGYFWSSTSWDNGYASGKDTYSLRSSDTALRQSGYDQNYNGGCSLRCIRD